jgi:hypothetical protein
VSSSAFVAETPSKVSIVCQSASMRLATRGGRKSSTDYD